MESILQTLQSYFNFRGAVLRTLATSPLSKDEFARITGLTGDSKYRRQQNPTLWQPVEVNRLAVELGLGDGVTNRLMGLAPMLVQLPDKKKRRLLSASKLSAQKLRLRLEDANSWQAQELEKLKSGCDQISAVVF